MFNPVSPLRMWLNSCPIIPCNSSRVSNFTAPRVTPIAMSSRVWPAANELIPRSLSKM